ncbi:MAG: DUF4203 domain-containing protein [Anaerolineales bacterium]
MAVFRLLIGAALLTLGRRLFWLFVAGVGFVIGLRLTGTFFSGWPMWLLVLIALIAGLISAALAVLFQRIGIAVAGFIAGGYAVYSLVELFSNQDGSWLWVVYAIGGIFGAILLSVLFDWALIVLSSITGSIIVLQAIDLAMAWRGLLFFALLIVGVIFQSTGQNRRRRRAIGF